MMKSSTRCRCVLLNSPCQTASVCDGSLTLTKVSIQSFHGWVSSWRRPLGWDFPLTSLNQKSPESDVKMAFILTSEENSKPLSHSALLSAWRSSFMRHATQCQVWISHWCIQARTERFWVHTVPGSKDIQLVKVSLNIEKSLLFNLQTEHASEFLDPLTLRWRKVSV